MDSGAFLSLIPLVLALLCGSRGPRGVDLAELGLASGGSKINPSITLRNRQTNGIARFSSLTGIQRTNLPEYMPRSRRVMVPHSFFRGVCCKLQSLFLLFSNLSDFSWRNWRGILGEVRLPGMRRS